MKQIRFPLNHKHLSRFIRTRYFVIGKFQMQLKGRDVNKDFKLFSFFDENLCEMSSLLEEDHLSH